MNRYPYIPREYYPAVMFACKMVRESGYKNKAIRTAARYYGVDEDEVRKHFEARTAAGAKGKGNTRKKYKYFVIGTYYGSDAGGMDENPSRIEVVKGISKDTVEKRFAESDLYFDKSNAYGGSYAPYRFHTVIGEYETKEEAEKAAKVHKGE